MIECIRSQYPCQRKEQKKGWKTSGFFLQNQLNMAALKGGKYKMEICRGLPLKLLNAVVDDLNICQSIVILTVADKINRRNLVFQGKTNTRLFKVIGGMRAGG